MSIAKIYSLFYLMRVTMIKDGMGLSLKNLESMIDEYLFDDWEDIYDAFTNGRRTYGVMYRSERAHLSFLTMVNLARCEECGKR